MTHSVSVMAMIFVQKEQEGSNPGRSVIVDTGLSATAFNKGTREHFRHHLKECYSTLWFSGDVKVRFSDEEGYNAVPPSPTIDAGYSTSMQELTGRIEFQIGLECFAQYGPLSDIKLAMASLKAEYFDAFKLAIQTIIAIGGERGAELEVIFPEYAGANPKNHTWDDNDAS